MKIDLAKFDYTQCSLDNVDEILALQEEVIASLDDPAILRRNTKQMFCDCVQSPNFTVGVRYGGKLVGLGILYVPQSEEEDLSHLLKGVDINGKKSANYKLCMVAKDYRGNGLQVKLGQILGERAKALGVELLCATVSPDNEYSRNNMLKLGFEINDRVAKYGGIRDLFFKFV